MSLLKKLYCIIYSTSFHYWWIPRLFFVRYRWIPRLLMVTINFDVFYQNIFSYVPFLWYLVDNFDETKKHIFSTYYPSSLFLVFLFFAFNSDRVCFCSFLRSSNSWISRGRDMNKQDAVKRIWYSIVNHIIREHIFF